MITSSRPADLPKCPIIGVTGSIASGKSVFCAALQRLGAKVIDADVLAREALAPSTPGFTAAVDRYGSRILKNHEIDRAALASIIFSNNGERLWLESILHPAIRKRLGEILKDIVKGPSTPLVVYVAPLLFEAGVPDYLDLVVLISSPESVLIKRAVARGLSEHDAKARLARQMPDQEKRNLADIVVENRTSLAELESSANQLYEQLTNNFSSFSKRGKR